MLKSKRRVSLPILLGILLCFLLHTEYVLAGMQDALRICGHSIIPSLFVYLVLSDYIFSVVFSGSVRASWIKWVIFLLGSVCGFPVGATVCEYCVQHGIITANEANRMLPFCNNASPAFLLGAVGSGVFGDIRVGLLLFFIQFFISLVMILPVKVQAGNPNLAIATLDLSNQFFVSVEKAIAAILKICALICLFSSVLAIGKAYLPQRSVMLFAVFSEIGNGIATVKSLGKNAFAAGVCGFACVWSGICVYLQVVFVSRSMKVKHVYYLVCKFFCGVIAGVFTYAVYKIWICP